MTTAATGASGSNGLLVGIGSAGNAELWNYEAQPIIFATSSSERMRIDSSGNVGIGTTSPDMGIHLSSTGTNYLRVTNTTTGVGSDFGTSSTGTEIINRQAAPIRFHTNATERMRLDSAGRLGIGTSSPSQKLHVVGDVLIEEGSGFPRITLKDSDGTNTQGFLDQSGGDLGFTAQNGTSHGRIRFKRYDGTTTETSAIIDTSGNLGIGTTSPSAPLHVVGNSYVQSGTLYTDTISAYSGSSVNINAGSSHFNVTVNGSERARIDSSGNLLVGTTDSTPNGLTVNGAIVALNDGTRYAISLATSTTASATAAAISNTNGLVGSITTSGSATSYNTSSDARLKDVTGEARGLDVINALNPVSYNWKADDKADEGLIAQEVQEIVPNAVSQNEDEYYQMDYSKLVVHLVKGMKEQQEQIEALQSEINLLKGE
jgi:hypothetical protein